jgi:hypothetical protein
MRDLTAGSPGWIRTSNHLPSFKHGDWLFSTTHGRKPLWLGSKVKQSIDVKMLEQLQHIAEERGDDPQKVKLQALGPALPSLRKPPRTPC